MGAADIGNTQGNAGETWDWSPASLPVGHRMPRHCDTVASRGESVMPLPTTSRSRPTWILMSLGALEPFLMFVAYGDALRSQEN